MTKWASLPPGLLLAVLFQPMGALAETPCPVLEATHVQVGKQRFRVEVAADEVARERGLSGRASLPADAGMWFVMPTPGLHGFWMKDMRFPIDLVWIGPDLRVLGMKRLTPCERGDWPHLCPSHAPPAPATYVMEVGAGRFTGQPGDRVDWLCAPRR